MPNAASEGERAATPVDENRERLLRLLLKGQVRRDEAVDGIRPRDRGREFIPLSFAQERLWFLDKLGLVGSAYNAPLAIRLSGAVVEKALEASFTELVRRHESLRTRFAVSRGLPHQLIDPPPVLFPIAREDFSQVLDSEERERRLSDFIDCEQAHHFNLESGPLLRVALVKLSSIDHVLLIGTHHIVTDGWSFGVLIRELSALYSGYLEERTNVLPELSVQYADYAMWQRQTFDGERLDEHLRYWKEQLAGAPQELRLPLDHPRPPVESFKGQMLRFEFSTRLLPSIKALARAEGATLFMVFLAAFQLLLSRWSGQRDVVVGSPIAGRTKREIEGLIGFFVNTLPLRTEIEPNLTFRQLVQRVKDVTLSAYAHQDLPFEALVAELRPERNLSRQPLFQVALAMQNYPEERLELPGLTWAWTGMQAKVAHFDITLYLQETATGLSAALEYATDLFEPESIERMAGHLIVLLERVAADPDFVVGQVPLLRTSERSEILHEFSDGASSYGRERLVHQLFEDEVRKAPDSTALVFGHQYVTYSQLNSRSNQLARHLLNQGICPDEPVGLCVERGIDMVVGVLGIMKAGGAYLPLDASYPAARLLHMVEDSAPTTILTNEGVTDNIPPALADMISLKKKLGQIADYVDDELTATELGLRWQHLVYVIYTSGSTGKPKGTAMTHRSMVNLIEWHRKAFGIQAGRRTLQFAALSFDVAFQEMFSTLCCGGTLVLLDEWLRRDATALFEFVKTQAVARLFVPPQMLHAIAESWTAASIQLAGGLEDVIAAGEQLRLSARIVDFFSGMPRCRLHNHYGPTETHVVTAHVLQGDPRQWPYAPPIGRPISNTQTYVLDDYREPVPIGVAGEIYLSGAGVSRGYVRKPTLTANRFVADKFGDLPGGRLYRTGDIGRWKRDGTLEYLGRADDQVKIRGYRIELAEIEIQLARHAQIKEAAVIVRETGADEKRLVAYVTLRGIDETLSVQDVDAHLSTTLPSHMVPSVLIVLSELPLTPTGKVDRRALKTVRGIDVDWAEYEPPQGDAEKSLAGIWQELLGVERVGRHDNFFALGGHSLHGMRLVARVYEKMHVMLPVISVFQYPTLSRMAGVVGRLREPEDAGAADQAEYDEGYLWETGGEQCRPSEMP